jgi:hypothetical protein
MHLWIDLLTALCLRKNARWMIEDFVAPVSLRETAKYVGTSHEE